MRYNDHVRFTRPGQGGTQDPDTGVFTPAAPTVLYDGECDAQDVAAILRRDAAGFPTLTADITIFLPWCRWPVVADQDDGVVTFADGGSAVCKVVGFRHLDRTIYVTTP